MGGGIYIITCVRQKESTLSDIPTYELSWGELTPDKTPVQITISSKSFEWSEKGLNLVRVLCTMISLFPWEANTVVTEVSADVIKNGGIVLLY